MIADPEYVRVPRAGRLAIMGSSEWPARRARGTRKGHAMNDVALKPGTAVRITVDAVGTIRLADPYRFTDYIAEKGDTGHVYSSPGAMPDGWILVRLDANLDDTPADEHLFAPVHPSMVEAVTE